MDLLSAHHTMKATNITVSPYSPEKWPFGGL